MKRLVVFLHAVALAGVSGAAAGVCGDPGAPRSHCCCHPDDTGDAVATPCQCRIAPQSEHRSDSLPPSVSGPHRADVSGLSAPGSVAHCLATAWSFAPRPADPSPPVSPPSYLTARSFRC